LNTASPELTKSQLVARLRQLRDWRRAQRCSCPTIARPHATFRAAMWPPSSRRFATFRRLARHAIKPKWRGEHARLLCLVAEISVH